MTYIGEKPNFLESVTCKVGLKKSLTEEKFLPHVKGWYDEFLTTRALSLSGFDSQKEITPQSAFKTFGAMF